ncbi:MAG: FAD-binding protein, partial [Candidatus Hermodarchaeota archaeon]
MNEFRENNEVTIIGGGFAGMNVARILSKNNIKCKIYSSGFGASNLWVGTIDFLKTQKNNLEEAFNDFKKSNSNHPYNHLNFNELDEAVLNFSSDFPELKFFKKNDQITNNLVLTIIGNLKLCIGIWNTIFHNLELFKNSEITF